MKTRHVVRFLTDALDLVGVTTTVTTNASGSLRTRWPSASAFHLPRGSASSSRASCTTSASPPPSRTTPRGGGSVGRGGPALRPRRAAAGIARRLRFARAVVRHHHRPWISPSSRRCRTRLAWSRTSSSSRTGWMRGSRPALARGRSPWPRRAPRSARCSPGRSGPRSSRSRAIRASGRHRPRAAVAKGRRDPAGDRLRAAVGEGPGERPVPDGRDRRREVPVYRRAFLPRGRDRPPHGEAMALPSQECEELRTAGLLHDIGKLAIPDAIVNKRGPLDAGERRVMEGHASHSYDVIVRLPGLERVAELAATTTSATTVAATRPHRRAVAAPRRTHPRRRRRLPGAHAAPALPPRKGQGGGPRDARRARRSGWLDAQALDASSRASRNTGCCRRDRSTFRPRAGPRGSLPGLRARGSAAQHHVERAAEALARALQAHRDELRLAPEAAVEEVALVPRSPSKNACEVRTRWRHRAP